MEFESIMNDILNEPVRVLHRSFDSLCENYTDENAIIHRSTYMYLPLRTILEESEYIFKEHQYGLPFFMGKMNSFVPYYEYRNQKEKIEDYLESIEGKVPQEVIRKFEEARDILEDKEHAFSHTSNVAYNCALKNNDLDLVYNLIEAVDTYQLEESEDARVAVLNSANALYRDPVERFLYCVPALSLIQENDQLREFANDMTSRPILEEQEALSTHFLFQYMMEDIGMQYQAVHLSDNRCSYYLRGLNESSLVPLFLPDLNEMIEEAMEQTEEIMEQFDFSTDGIFDYGEETIQYQEAFEETIRMEREENTSRYQEQRSFLLESVYESLSYMIRDDQTKNDTKIFDTYFENFDTLEELQISLTEGVIQDRVARDMAEKKKPSQAVEKASSLQNNQIKKPKKSINTKMQTVAIDSKRKAQDLTSKMRRGVTNVVNTAKAVVDIPKTVIDTIESEIEEYKRMNKEKRKRYLLEHKTRNKYYEMLTNAAHYGLGKKIHPLLVPLQWFYKRMRKQEDRQLHAELQSELKTEIGIIDEKINASEGDKKYNYMRIRASLERELVAFQSYGKFA